MVKNNDPRRPIRVVETTREVIEKRLLKDITDPESGVVALVLNECSIRRLITALGAGSPFETEATADFRVAFVRDLQRLKKGAFG